jgi:hypothetical protein
MTNRFTHNTRHAQPKPTTPTAWDIYQVAEKSVRLGTVEAPDKQAAIEKGAKEFKTEAWRLYAVAKGSKSAAERSK